MNLIGDSLYRFLSDHPLPIYHYDKDVLTFLRQYFSAYITDIENCLNQKESHILQEDAYDSIRGIMPLLKKSKDLLIEFLELKNSGKTTGSINKFNEYMQTIQDYIPKRTLWPQANDRYHIYYRIRCENITEKPNPREEMFHIPMSKRYLIKPERFSISGQPCLYLANGIETCFFECGMPKEFSCAMFKLNVPEGQKIQVIDFSKDERSIAVDIDVWLHNYPEDKDKIHQYLCQFIVSFPLRAACSIAVSNHNAPFIEEYIIPQQLTSWIVEHDQYFGILYQTCSDNHIARSWTSVNLVLPATAISGDYCNRLRQLFTVSEPIYVKVKDKICSGIYDTAAVDSVISEIRHLNDCGQLLDAYKVIESLCVQFKLIIQSLTTENYRNPELLDLSLKSIMQSADLILANKEAIREQSLNRYIEIVATKDECRMGFERIMQLFEKARTTMVLYSSYESVVCTQLNLDRDTLHTI